MREDRSPRPPLSFRLPGSNRYIQSPALPQDTAIIPSYRWPDDRSRLPSRCTNDQCRSSLLEVDPPDSLHGIGAVTCMMCSRQFAWLTSGLSALSAQVRGLLK